MQTSNQYDRSKQMQNQLRKEQLRLPFGQIQANRGQAINDPRKLMGGQMKPPGSPQAIPQANTKPALVASAPAQGQAQEVSQQEVIPTMNPSMGDVPTQSMNPHQTFIQEALKQGYSPDMVMQFMTAKLNLR